MQLHGQSILVVEDEAFIALDVVGMVEDAGGIAVGPAESVRRALELLDAELVTAAILDLNVRDGEVTPVATRLTEQSIPFIVHTGGTLPSRLRATFGAAPVLMKPARDKQIIDTLSQVITSQQAERLLSDAPGQHVLLIEDEAATATILEGHMRALGFASVEQAETELDALLAARRRRPDLMVVDIKLREGSGLAAAATIKAAFGVPLIVVTAHPQSAVGVEADLVVPKPFTSTSLRAAIDRARETRAAA